jgi:hypothetical protein
MFQPMTRSRRVFSLPVSWDLGADVQIEPTKLITVGIDDIASGRIKRCVGVAPAENLDGGIDYAMRAFTAAGDWEDYSDELPEIDPPEGYDQRDYVALVRLSDDLLSAWRRLAANADEQSPPQDPEAIDILRTEMMSHFAISGEGILNAFSRNAPRLRTVTWLDDRRVGFHLDNRDDDQTACRFCINLGEQPRHLLLLSGAAHRVAEAVNVEMGRRIEMGWRLMDAVPSRDHTVYALRMDPGDAYVLATQWVVHDGSTRWTDAEDVSITGWIDAVPRTLS